MLRRKKKSTSTKQALQFCSNGVAICTSGSSPSEVCSINWILRSVPVYAVWSFPCYGKNE
ncbi:hypothetical protein CDL15_Pgr001542 [Punica granatum]|uniref:Uncharacterized protein n=1 Tax=Punica granatum TaxID=22663 RepID=A0A218X589_PUNGR|nr:hypothetical protein CDL15_Pgr001542 [Punica granatum]